MDPLLLVHAAATLFLCGLIWTMQTVHYPLFARVGRGSFTAYEREHQSRVGRIVVPAMIAELVTGVVLLVAAASPQARGIHAAGLGLIALIWIATAVLAVPRHRELARGFDTDAHHGLVRANWIRTIAWSARSVLILWMVGSPGMVR